MLSDRLSLALNRVRARLRPTLPYPPLDLMVAIGSTSEENFDTIGREFVGYFRQLGGLDASSRVLHPLGVHLVDPGRHAPLETGQNPPIQAGTFGKRNDGPARAPAVDVGADGHEAI